MQQSFTVEENLQACVAEIRVKYRETCEVLGVKSLPVTVGKVLATVITSNMRDIAKQLYNQSIQENSKETIKDMVKSFQTDEKFKTSLFKNEPVQMEVSCSDNKLSRYASPEWRKYQHSRCWYFDHGWCRHGSSCPYIHEPHDDPGYESDEKENSETDIVTSEFSECDQGSVRDNIFLIGLPDMCGVVNPHREWHDSYNMRSE